VRLIAVAQNTFRESVRDKVLYVLLFFAVGTILGSKALGWITVGQDIQVVKTFTLSATSLFGVLIAIFVGTSLIYKEIDKRTLYTILSQPMHRSEFVLGKYLGLMALLALVTVVMTGLSAVYILFLGGGLTATYFLAALLIYVELLLITAVAILLSALAAPMQPKTTILGAIIVFSVYVIGHATGILRDLPPQLEGTAAEKILGAAYYVIPNLANFDIKSEAANDVAIAGTYVVLALLYGLGYTALVLILAAVAFEEKDV